MVVELVTGFGRDFGTQAAAPNPRNSGPAYDAGYVEPGMRASGGNGGMYGSAYAGAPDGEIPPFLLQMRQQWRGFLDSKGNGRPAPSPSPSIPQAMPSVPGPIFAGGQQAAATPATPAPAMPGPGQTVAGLGGGGITPAMQTILQSMMPAGAAMGGMNLRPLMNRGG